MGSLNTSLFMTSYHFDGRAEVRKLSGSPGQISGLQLLAAHQFLLSPSISLHKVDCSIAKMLFL